MSIKFASHVAQPLSYGVPSTPANKFQPGREQEMALNNSGAAVFTISPMDHLTRFLILGTSGGTFYASEEKHTYQAFEGLLACIAQDPLKTVDLIVDVSTKGRAASNDPALFALATVLARGSIDAKIYARKALSSVARTGTDLLHFAEFVKGQKGWGAGTRKAFANWYLSKTPDEVAFQYVKYGQRDGWSHRDILRKAHPASSNSKMNTLFKVMAQPSAKLTEVELALLPDVWRVARELQDLKGEPTKAASLISKYRMPREAVPTELLNHKEIWEAMLPHMPPTALLRNLGKITSLGLFGTQTTNNIWTNLVTGVFSNVEVMKRARVHPVNILKALYVYRSGKGVKGSLLWNYNSSVEQALNASFLKSFDHVVPTGKTFLLGLDVSGSMSMNYVAGVPGLTCRDAAACMALATVKAERNTMVMGFTDKLVPLDITKDDTFDSARIKTIGLPFGNTDCSLPMLTAMTRSIPVDCFAVYTDNETNSNSQHPSEALRMYRNKMSMPKSKLAVVAFTATQFSIADPKDPYMLDFVGFDTQAPKALSEFAGL